MVLPEEAELTRPLQSRGQMQSSGRKIARRVTRKPRAKGRRVHITRTVRRRCAGAVR
jgi:hypothetical protein